MIRWLRRWWREGKRGSTGCRQIKCPLCDWACDYRYDKTYIYDEIGNHLLHWHLGYAGGLQTGWIYRHGHWWLRSRNPIGRCVPGCSCDCTWAYQLAMHWCGLSKRELLEHYTYAYFQRMNASA